MKKRVLILAAAVLLALVLAVPASASKSTEVKGFYRADWATFRDETVPVGDRCFVNAWYDTAYDGDIVASCENHGWQVAHGPCTGSFPGSYKETIHLESDCTATLPGFGGKSGTFRLRCNGQILPGADPPEVWVMNWRQDCVILSGTDDLAKLHGSLALEWLPRPPDPLTQPGTYSGEIHFDPK